MQVRDLALRERDDLYASKCYPLEDASDILLVTTDAIERSATHDLKATTQRVSEQRLNSGTDERCAG